MPEQSREKIKVWVSVSGDQIFSSTVPEANSLRKRIELTLPDFECVGTLMERGGNPDIIVSVSWDGILRKVVYEVHIVSYLGFEDDAVAMIQGVAPLSRKLQIDPEKLYKLALELDGGGDPAAMRPKGPAGNSGSGC